ncbi:hypothetical protein Aph01nite_72200 [Acrocarpospora phusangensis]|uniref:Uncharacterized protein n=1 Tax=Acrocarpospora phusangensis TaxID=1070424 RepID=A0A919UUZ9_9ACTN|nr:hypothetical protein Aph01nite_72200 [Acrocarpospora phusangensis]
MCGQSAGGHSFRPRGRGSYTTGKNVITLLDLGATSPKVPAAAVWAALGVGAVVAVFRQSMGRVLLAGMAAYALVALVVG